MFEIGRKGILRITVKFPQINCEKTQKISKHKMLGNKKRSSNTIKNYFPLKKSENYKKNI